MKLKVLLIEDDMLMREFITDYFKRENWEIYEADDGKAGLECFNQTNFDLVILDIMLPKMDGWSVCKYIREKSEVPIIIITAKSEDDDQILGFELGADEYVTKPLSPRVLVARANALIKRREGIVVQDGDTEIYGNIRINRSAHTVSIAHEKILLSPKEYDLFIFLIKHYGKVLHREYILNAVWGYDYMGDLRTVDTHIKKLRAKLGVEGKYIYTVIRSGYKFEVES